jgi:hypothetical protein
MIMKPKKIIERHKPHKEITELERRLVEKKRELEEKKEVKHEKELIKEVIKEKAETPGPPKVTAPPPKKVVIKKAKQLKGQQKKRQIKLLTDLAFEKGVIHATEVAQKLDDPYILDEFHDTLVDELYNYLVEQGKLKQV